MALDAMGVTCFSAAHETTLRRPLSLSLNARDFEAVPPGRAVPYTYYRDPPA